MRSKIMNFLRLVVLVVPVVFILGSVVSNCSDGDVDCDGTVLTNTSEECTDYGIDNGCESAVFVDGLCEVNNCLNCEVIVDDDDPVIDIDDSGFFDDGF